MAEMVGGKLSVSTLLHKLRLFPPIEWLDPRLILCIGAPTEYTSPSATALRISAHRGRHFRLIVDGISA
jgi:hypothetical protein